MEAVISNEKPIAVLQNVSKYLLLAKDSRVSIQNRLDILSEKLAKIGDPESYAPLVGLKKKFSWLDSQYADLCDYVCSQDKYLSDEHLLYVANKSRRLLSSLSVKLNSISYMVYQVESHVDAVEEIYKEFYILRSSMCLRYATMILRISRFKIDYESYSSFDSVRHQLMRSVAIQSSFQNKLDEFMSATKASTQLEFKMHVICQELKKLSDGFSAKIAVTKSSILQQYFRSKHVIIAGNLRYVTSLIPDAIEKKRKFVKGSKKRLVIKKHIQDIQKYINKISKVRNIFSSFIINRKYEGASQMKLNKYVNEFQDYLRKVTIFVVAARRASIDIKNVCFLERYSDLRVNEKASVVVARKAASPEFNNISNNKEFSAVSCKGVPVRESQNIHTLFGGHIPPCEGGQGVDCNCLEISTRL